MVVRSSPILAYALPREFGIVSDLHKFIVKPVAKCASSTIRAEFKKEDYQGYEHRVIHWNTEQVDHYKKFFFLRDPVERFLSGYFSVYKLHNLRGKRNRDKGIVEERPLEFLDMDDTVATIFRFLQHIRERGFFNVHVKPQTLFIEGLKIDMYFPVEKLTEGVNRIREMYDLPPYAEELPVHHQNRYTRKRRPFAYTREEVPDALIREIEQIYRADMDLYERELFRG